MPQIRLAGEHQVVEFGPVLSRAINLLVPANAQSDPPIRVGEATESCFGEASVTVVLFPPENREG